MTRRRGLTITCTGTAQASFVCIFQCCVRGPVMRSVRPSDKETSQEIEQTSRLVGSTFAGSTQHRLTSSNSFHISMLLFRFISNHFSFTSISLISPGLCVANIIRLSISSFNAGTSTLLNPLGNSFVLSFLSQGGEIICIRQCIESSPRIIPEAW